MALFTPRNTLHHIVAGLMRHLRLSGRVIDLFRDAEFGDFCASLDSEMKRLQREVVRSQNTRLR